jgi:hypothetical protein
MNSTKPKIKIIEVKKTMNTVSEENRIHRTEKKNTNIENINSTNNLLELKSNTIEAKALAIALSFLEEIFRLLKIPYSYDTKKYIWNIESLISRAKEEICKIETNFELNKKRPYVIQLREKFDLPYNRMINAINHDLLAIDPYQEEQEIEHAIR